MAYEFHYTPTGTGVISGKEVLEQTEDAINDLGNTAISGVQEALDKAEQALTNSANAVDDAQTALNTANNAEGVAIQAQNDVSNLSGTVTNIGNRVTTAEGNITNLQGRMTTAEGNITNLQGRMTTAEGNIGNLQTAVSTAQATANSAQQTATTARQQSYVFRYSSTALVASSTNSNTLLDNTDNLKVGDKVIDSSGVLFSITAIDTQNSTFTIGTALVDLAQDSDVVHKSGNETLGGIKTFSNDIRINKIYMFSSGYIKGQAPTSNMYSGVRFFDDINSGSPNNITGGFEIEYNRDGYNKSYIVSRNYAGETHKFFNIGLRVPNDDIRSIDFLPSVDGIVNLGTSTNKWKTFNGLEPSSLSLPNPSNNIDISAYFTYTGTGETNVYTVPSNGWIFLYLATISSCEAKVLDAAQNVLWGTNVYGFREMLMIPVVAGSTLQTQWTTEYPTVTVLTAKFYPCQGNI